MSSLPWYVWAVAAIGVLGIPAATSAVLYRGAVRSGARRRRAGLLAGTAAVLLGAWLVGSAALAGTGQYSATSGFPWFLIAFVLVFAGMLASTRIPLVSQALAASTSSLILVNTWRLAGLAFVLAMLAGQLPALFALPAGLGDIAVGIAAPFVAARVAQGRGYRGALWFEALGILDLVVALALGALTILQIVDVTPVNHAITELPLALIPTVPVPVILTLQIVSTLQLLRLRPRARALAAPAFGG